LETKYLILITIAVVGALAYFFFVREKPAKPQQMEKPAGAGSVSLQLQAYERLILLVDRITIPNLISRTPYEGLSAREMQLVLTRNIRDEFDYNITQQIYVTPETWNAVKNLKEKNLLIINQAGSMIPASATGLDLNKAILEFLMNDSRANQHELVSEALSFEAKKLL
jgi:hypothetical protein